MRWTSPAGSGCSSSPPTAACSADNLTVSPWGDLIVCEDAQTSCSLVGVTPQGELYRFAENAYMRSELAGACFAPDWRTLFVNLQALGLTLAIEGPFPGFATGIGSSAAW